MKLFAYTIINLSLIISMSDPALASGKGGGQKGNDDSDRSEIHTTFPQQSPRLSEPTREGQSKAQFTSKKGPLKYDEAKKLYESKDEDEKKSGRSGLLSLAIIDSSDALAAARLLLNGDPEEDKIPIIKVLCSIAQREPVSMSNVYVAEILFKSMVGSEKEIGRKILYDAVEFPQKYYNSGEPKKIQQEYIRNVHYYYNRDRIYDDQLLVQLKTANTLIEMGNEHDQQKAMRALNRTYHIMSESLLDEGGRKPLKMFCLMSCNRNPLRLNACKVLLEWGDKESKNIAISQLLDLAKEGQYEAAQLLAKRDEKAYLEGMKHIAQMAGHPNRFEAAKILYDMGKDYSDIGKKVLSEISQQKNHPNQKDAMEALKFCTIV